MSPLRVIVVEDVAPVREHLVKLLGARADVEVVGVCQDGRSAIATIRTVQADLVLLDVQMPECDGFEVMSAVGAAMPDVIIVTAHQDHAVRAFEVRAIDYLLKPFSRERVDRAIDVAIEGKRQRRLNQAAKTMAELMQGEDAPGRDERIIVRRRGERVFVRRTDVLWAESQGNDVILHTVDALIRCRATLASIHQQLGHAFLQVHRSVLVNIDAAGTSLLVDGGSTRLRLSNGDEIRVSRACRPEVERRLRTQ